MHIIDKRRLSLIDDPEAYRLRVMRRLRLGGELVKVGDTVATPALHLALHLAGCGFATPADARTRLDVALGLALRRAIPRHAPTPPARA